jgi:hypothetical protein
VAVVPARSTGHYPTRLDNEYVDIRKSLQYKELCKQSLSKHSYQAGLGYTEGTMLKRLIEVALPLKEVSEQSAREKSIRHGHISTLHIWWARRPLATHQALDTRRA